MKSRITTFLFFLTSLAGLCQGIDSTKFDILEPLTMDTLSSAFFTNKFGSIEKGVVFFYPNNKLREQHDLAIKQISINPRFKNSKIIAVPCEKTIDDNNNVYFEQYNVSNIQCFLFGSPSKDLGRAIEANSSIKLIDSIAPPNFYFIEIDIEIICVKKDRITFHEDIIMDFVDPILTEKHQIEDLQEEVERLKTIIEELGVSFNCQIEKLEKELRSELDKKSDKSKRRKK